MIKLYLNEVSIEMKMLVNNKKAYYNYEVIQKVEAGIVLEGWEVKSVKAGKFNISGAYIKHIDNELFLVNARVVSYKFGRMKNREQEHRERKILLRKRQITRLATSSKQIGYTIVPLEVYENDIGLIKLTIALVKGKKKYSKKAKLKERDMKRRVEFERKKYNI